MPVEPEGVHVGEDDLAAHLQRLKVELVDVEGVGGLHDGHQSAVPAGPHLLQRRRQADGGGGRGVAAAGVDSGDGP